MRSRLASYVLPLLLAACAESIRPGQLGAPCPSDNNCIPSLRCVEGKCNQPPPDAGAPPADAGGVDAGPPIDAGGAPPDAGAEDAGPEDTGPVDAGGCVAPRLSTIQSEIFGASGQGTCNLASCHGAGAAAGIRLDTPLAQLHQTLLGTTRDPQAPQTRIVAPGDPDASRLYVIMSNQTPAGTGSAMPPGQLVPACERVGVRQWILDGAPEN